jgi:hypothetical protein
MSARENTKRRILEGLEGLSEDRLQDVLDFIDSLRGSVASRVQGDERSLDPKKDPVLAYAGGVALGCLAKDIDATLYGG